MEFYFNRKTPSFENNCFLCSPLGASCKTLIDDPTNLDLISGQISKCLQLFKKTFRTYKPRLKYSWFLFKKNIVFLPTMSVFGTTSICS